MRIAVPRQYGREKKLEPRRDYSSPVGWVLWTLREPRELWKLKAIDLFLIPTPESPDRVLSMGYLVPQDRVNWNYGNAWVVPVNNVYPRCVSQFMRVGNWVIPDEYISEFERIKG